MPDLAAFLGGGIVGFFLDKLWTWWNGRRQRKKQGQVASLLVSDELRANIVRLEIALEGTPEAISDLQSETYLGFQAVLADFVDSETRDAVRAAYVFARVPRALHRVERVGGPFTVSAAMAPARSPVFQIDPIPEQVNEALSRAKRARDQLARYAGPAAEI